MNLTRLRAVCLLAIWTVTALGFAVTIVAAGGPAHYSDASPHRVLGAAFLAFGLLGGPVARGIIRARGRKGGLVLQDERDRLIEARATSIGLVVIMLAVFLTCIALWERHQAEGAVPVGWMWVIAYSALVLSHLAPVSVSLLIDLGVIPHGQG